MRRRDPTNRIPIVRDGELVGIVARHDLLKLMLENTGPITTA
jgi:CBS domain-containing protein